MGFSDDNVREILEAIERSDWEEVRLVSEDVTLWVSRSGPPTLAPPATAATPETVPAGTPHAAPRLPREAALTAWPGSGEPMEVLDEAHAETPAPPASHAQRHDVTTVLAPSLGLFWRSPKPGAPPFVEVGDRVEPDSTVCIVEVMKLMNHVKAGCTGIVSTIHAKDGEMVEFGQPLVTVAPQ